MSLYYEAADLISSLGNSQDASLKSLLFSKTKTNGQQTRKSNPAQLYALISESWKWSPILKDVVERAGLLSLERKLSPQLALVLVHDLLLAKKGIAAPESHVLRKSVEAHKARLRAEFTKARIRHGCASVEELKAKLGNGIQNSIAAVSTTASTTAETDSERPLKKWSHPRWLRINTLRASLVDILQRDFSDWEKVDSNEALISFQSPLVNGKTYHIDKHIPNLLALPPSTDLASIPAYKRGELISQDKASCFPAYLLSSGGILTGSILDACAAPGNKTSHIAAILAEQTRSAAGRSGRTRVYATERNPQRAEVLKKMLAIAGADEVDVRAGQDFFRLDPNRPPWNSISGIILDPSCSGSGIVDRGQVMTFDLPSATAAANQNGTSSKNNNKKRKREAISTEQQTPAKIEDVKQGVTENDVEITESNTRDLQTRLKSLAALQTKMLTFAFSFPKVQRITYSTCSIHDIENENVVVAALASDVARENGWRIMKRSEQVEGLRRWERRGRLEACTSAIEKQGSTKVDADEVAQACIRCEPFTAEGTQGFFVAGLIRDLQSSTREEVQDTVTSEGEWGGFAD